VGNKWEITDGKSRKYDKVFFKKTFYDSVFDMNNGKTSCVYLYMIGNARELLGDGYEEEYILCKYGCTDDLVRRGGEHERKYYKEYGKKIELLCFSIIDVKYIFEAESNITQYFRGNVVENNGTREMIVIKKKELVQIRQHYMMIQNSYIGRYEEMNNKIVEMERELVGERHKNELKDKDIEIKKMELEMKNKDIEILQYKIKILESQNPK
jgi:hypothetical protein